MRLFLRVLISLSLMFVATATVVAQVSKRDPSVLLNQYYFLKKDHPEKAQEALVILLREFPNDVKGLQEMGYWYLAKKNDNEALGYFQKAFALDPSDRQLALQLGYLLAKKNESAKAKSYFELAAQSPDAAIKAKAEAALKNFAASPPVSQNSQLTLASQPPVRIELPLPVIAQQKSNDRALLEMAYIELNKKNKRSALEYFLKAYKIKPEAKIAAQIGYLYNEQKNLTEALIYFQKAKKTTDKKLQQASLKAIKVIEADIAAKKHPQKTVVATAPVFSLTEKLLNQYYAVRKKNIEQAEKILQRVLVLQPNNIKGLTEMGYLQVEKKDNAAAYVYFKRVYAQTKDPQIAAQLGYICDALNRKRDAYYYFAAATKTSDPKLRLASNLAMTNLAGQQSRVLPDPYFIEAYFDPAYFSRFDLGIFDTIDRIGRTFGDNQQGEIYGSLRATRDDKSAGAGVSPQIYDDNVAILAIGMQYQPFIKAPLYFYGELGRAYDLIDRNRDRWRGDFRGGAIYYQDFGKKPTYTDHLTLPFKFVANVYGDGSYFTRYDNNFIATLRYRPGLRMAEYHSTYVNFYIDNQIIGDTNHEFFNNLFQWGPGVVLVPNDRYNFAVRFEALRGYYIKVNSPDPNPYGGTYNNKEVILEYYARF